MEFAIPKPRSQLNLKIEEDYYTIVFLLEHVLALVIPRLAARGMLGKWQNNDHRETFIARVRLEVSKPVFTSITSSMEAPATDAEVTWFATVIREVKERFAPDFHPLAAWGALWLLCVEYVDDLERVTVL